MKKQQHILRAAALAALAALLLSLTACGAPGKDTPTSDQPVPVSSSAPDSTGPAGEDNAPAAGEGGAQPQDADTPAQNTTDLFEGTVLGLGLQPTALLPLPDGDALIADGVNRVVIQLQPDGGMLLFAGDITEAVDVNDRPLGGYADGPAAESLFALPYDIAPFLDGYAISDAENNAVRLVKDGQVGTLNATGSNAKWNYPTGLAAGEDGCLYVSDTHNGRVCRISPEGRLTTVAKGLQEPMGLSWRDGVLYIAEAGANRVLQLADEKLTVLAGQGTDGFEDGKAAKALFCAPRGVLATENCVYVADTANSAIRCIKDGEVSTLLTRELGEQDQAFPISPTGLTLWKGNLYVCDTYTGALLKLPVEG